LGTLDRNVTEAQVHSAGLALRKRLLCNNMIVSLCYGEEHVVKNTACLFSTL